MEEIFRMSEEEKEELLLQLADWNPIRKLKVCSGYDRGRPSSLNPFSHMLSIFQC